MSRNDWAPALMTGRELIRGLLIALTVATLVSLGSMWAKDNDDEQKLYCQLVADGTQPDYKKIFEKDCKQPLTGEFKSVE